MSTHQPASRRIALRTGLPWLLAALGGVALFLGWWGASGTPLPGKQIPYLVSGGLTGVGLMVLAAALFASGDVRGQLAALEAMEQRVDELYQLLTEETGSQPDALVALPTGSSYHRAGCRLVTGRDEAEPLTAAQVRSRGLKPCRLCDPELA